MSEPMQNHKPCVSWLLLKVDRGLPASPTCCLSSGRIGLNVLFLSHMAYLDPGNNQVPEGISINHLICLGASNTGSITLSTIKYFSSRLKHVSFSILLVHSEQRLVVVVTETRASKSFWVPYMLLYRKKGEVELKCGLKMEYFHLSLQMVDIMIVPQSIPQK